MNENQFIIRLSVWKNDGKQNSQNPSIERQVQREPIHCPTYPQKLKIAALSLTQPTPNELPDSQAHPYTIHRSQISPNLQRVQYPHHQMPRNRIKSKRFTATGIKGENLGTFAIHQKNQ